MTALEKAVALNAHRVMAPCGIDKRILLLALADIESSGGKNNVPRWEAAYAGPNLGAKDPQHRKFGGYYYRKRSAPHVKAQWKRWGDPAAHSYGPWQILHITAWEFGYRGDPHDLTKTAVCLPYVIKLLNRRVFRHGDPTKGARNLADVADAWNSGTHRDANIPHGYIAKVKRAYTRRLASA